MELLPRFNLVLCVFLGICQSSLAQTVVRVSSVVDPPMLIAEDVGNVTVYSGYVVDLLAQLGSRTGLDFRLQQPQDGNYGSMASNGSWSGVMGELAENEADVGMMLTQTARRLGDVDFTQPLLAVEPVIVLVRPEVVFTWRERLQRLLVPVDLIVWLVLVLAFLVTSVVLYIACSVNPYEWRALGKRGGASMREVESFTCMNTFWFVISTLFWQGFVRAPRSIGGRIISVGWFSFVLIFILAYTASLINYLRVGPTPDVAVGYSRINSFKELAETDDVVVGMMSSGAIHNMFKNSDPDSDAGKVYKKAEDFMSQTVIKSNAEGIKLLQNRPVRHKSFAFIMESATARYLVSKRCDLYIVYDSLAHSYNAIGAKKGSKLLQTINSAVLALRENSQLTATEAKWFRTSVCPDVASEDKAIFTVPSFYPIELETISGAILVLIVGLVLGLFATCFEWCVNKCVQSGDDNTTEQDVKPDKDPGVSNHVTAQGWDFVDFVDGRPTIHVEPPPQPESRGGARPGSSTQV